MAHESAAFCGQALRKIGRLPRRFHATALVLFAAGTAPPAAAILCASGDTSSVGAPANSSVNLVTACVALAAVLAFEPPRSASPLAYARQLRARFLELQSTFDADDRRRPGEGKEKEDDRVPSEP